MTRRDRNHASLSFSSMPTRRAPRRIIGGPSPLAINLSRCRKLMRALRRFLFRDELHWQSLTV
jgi:hypothetical protein